jgi:hypothetical protein
MRVKRFDPQIRFHDGNAKAEQWMIRVTGGTAPHFLGISRFNPKKSRFWCRSLYRNDSTSWRIPGDYLDIRSAGTSWRCGWT